MNVLTVIILIFAILGALDWALGNRFGLGAEFEKGFYMFKAMALSMIGMLIIAPALASWLQPVFEGFYNIFRIDPSIIPASLFANDMGGASLSAEITKNEEIGGYNGFVVSSMMGCLISYTVPVALSIVKKEQHGEMFMGFLYGIITVPVGCFVAGLICELSFIQVLLNLLPLIIIAVIIAIGIIFVPDLSVKIFKFFGIFMKCLITVGLAMGIFTFLTGKTVVKEFASFEDAALICANACVTLAGTFPLMFVVSKIIGKPMAKLGNKMGINAASAMGFVSSVVSNNPTFEMMQNMDKKGVVLNSAFAVSAAFTFGGHLAFTMALDSSYVVPMIIGKLVSGVCAVLLAILLYKDKSKTACS